MLEEKRKYFDARTFWWVMWDEKREYFFNVERRIDVGSMSPSQNEGTWTGDWKNKPAAATLSAVAETSAAAG